MTFKGFSLKKKRKQRTKLLESFNSSLGLERNLDLILMKLQEHVKAVNFSFYLYQPSQENYALKAVRRLTQDTAIGPSYSGLLPYEKQEDNLPLTYPKERFPSETKLLKDGEVSVILMPIKGRRGFIIMDQVKNIRKKDLEILNGYSSLLETPLKELMYEVEQEVNFQPNHRKDRMQSAKNYALYYGYGKMDELSNFDLMIVESKGYTRAEFGQLKESKKVLFTYLSLFEVASTDPVFQELNEDDFLSVDGVPIRNEMFGTYMVNLRSKRWMEHLLRNIHHQLVELKADGLFLDTIGDLEDPLIPKPVKKEQLEAAINFLHVFKLLYPTHLLIQNNGLETVCMETAPYIDGICWENPPFSLDDSKEWNEQIVQRLSLLKERFQLKVFLLFEETMEKKRNSYPLAKKVADDKGFLLYHAPGNYVGEVRSKN